MYVKAVRTPPRNRLINTLDVFHTVNVSLNGKRVIWFYYYYLNHTPAKIEYGLGRFVTLHKWIKLNDKLGIRLYPHLELCSAYIPLAGASAQTNVDTDGQC